MHLLPPFDNKQSEQGQDPLAVKEPSPLLQILFIWYLESAPLYILHFCFFHSLPTFRVAVSLKDHAQWRIRKI